MLSEKIDECDIHPESGSPWIFCEESDTEEESSPHVQRMGSSMTQRTSSQSGLQRQSSTSEGTSSRSGCKQRGSGGSGTVASERMSSQSGLHGSSATSSRSSAAGAGPTSRSMSTASGSAEATERGMLGAGQETVTPKASAPQNPWNRFQRDNKGKGLSKRTMSQIYDYEKKQLSQSTSVAGILFVSCWVNLAFTIYNAIVNTMELLNPRFLFFQMEICVYRIPLLWQVPVAGGTSRRHKPGPRSQWMRVAANGVCVWCISI